MGALSSVWETLKLRVELFDAQVLCGLPPMASSALEVVHEGSVEAMKEAVEKLAFDDFDLKMS